MKAVQKVITSVQKVKKKYLNDLEQWPWPWNFQGQGHLKVKFYFYLKYHHMFLNMLKKPQNYKFTKISDVIDLEVDLMT